MDLPVQISISLFLKSYGASYGDFSEPGFPHNFATKKNDREDLKMGCIDASRRQLQSLLKIGVYTDFFLRNYGNLSFARQFSDLDCIFPIVILFKVGPDRIYARMRANFLKYIYICIHTKFRIYYYR
jgi:hypothetical protein